MKQFLTPNVDFDDELEKATLGVFLLEPHSFASVQSALVSECFHNEGHRLVFETIREMFDGGWPIDILMVQRRLYDAKVLTIGDHPTAYFLSTSMDRVTSSAHLEFWCVKLRELAIKRTAIHITNSGIDTSVDVLDIAGDIEAKLKQLTDLRTADDWEEGDKVAMKLLANMESIARGDAPTITTSIKAIDSLNGGLKAGQLILLGARPAVGKSAFMGRMAVEAAKAGKTVGVISLEMDSMDIFARMVAFNSDVPFWRMDKSSFLNADHYTEALNHIASTATLPIYFSDRADVSMRDIRAKAEKLKRKHGLDILFIDYLQLVESDSSKNAMREQEVAKISRGSKSLAKVLGIPIVMLVQLNRQADGELPQLKHLRESGSLEQDADIVLMLYRDTDTEDPMLKNKADLFVRKWRNGTTPHIPLHFNGEHMRFSEESEIDVFAPPPQFDKPSAGITRSFNPPSAQDQEPLPF